MSGRGPRLISVKRGTPIGSLAVGATVKLNVNSTPWEFLIVHQGLPSTLYDASCDGTWLLMKDIYEKRAWNSSKSNRYKTSTVNTWLNGDFLGLFDGDIQSAIKQVKIPYCIGGGYSEVNSGANGLSCKVFLLSGPEVGWTTSDNKYFPVDGAKLDYFIASSGGNSKRIAYRSGSAAVWGLRSPQTSRTDGVWNVRTDGSYNYDEGYYASNSYGIRPAIILPPDFIVMDDMLAA